MFFITTMLLFLHIIKKYLFLLQHSKFWDPAIFWSIKLEPCTKKIVQIWYSPQWFECFFFLLSNSKVLHYTMTFIWTWKNDLDRLWAYKFVAKLKNLCLAWDTSKNMDFSILPQICRLTTYLRHFSMYIWKS